MSNITTRAKRFNKPLYWILLLGLLCVLVVLYFTVPFVKDGIDIYLLAPIGGFAAWVASTPAYQTYVAPNLIGIAVGIPVGCIISYGAYRFYMWNLKRSVTIAQSLSGRGYIPTGVPPQSYVQPPPPQQPVPPVEEKPKP